MFWFTGKALEQGIELENIDGVQVSIYNLSKTIVDMFRFRNKLGLDVALEALDFAVHEKNVKKSEILEYARICRMEKVMLPYVEAMR